MGICKNDVLFTKHVPHILEKIFFSLDYGSYKKCLEVNSAWNTLLTSERYQRKRKDVYLEEILKDEDELVTASREGKSVEVIKLLCSGMVDVNCFGRTPGLACWPDSTPLYEAAWNGHKNVVQILIDKGADPNKANQWGQTPVNLAALAGHKDVVKLLLDKGADPNEASRSGTTPLHRASIEGHKYAVQLLLERGAEPNKTTYYDQDTPLHWAAFEGHLEVIQMLLEGGANRSMTDDNGKTPVQLAATKGHSEVVQLLSSATYFQEYGLQIRLNHI